MRIGDTLLQAGQLGQEALEEALDWQVLYGGRLGTNLLELQLVLEEHLARALGKQMSCEIAWGELQAAHDVVPLLPKNVADRDEMVPWKMEKRRLKILCTQIQLDRMDELAHKIGRVCVPVVAPEFRIFQLLRANYGAVRQMRALDFGVVPTERRKKRKEAAEPEPLAPELIDESEFNDLYNRIVQGGPAAEPSRAGSTPNDGLERLPEDAIVGESAPDDLWPPPPAFFPPASVSPTASAQGPASWDEPEAPQPDDAPLDFKEALKLLEGVSDRKAIAHIVLRASLSKARRALLMQVQGELALGWDALGEGIEQAAQIVAIPLSAPSAFQLVVKTRSHFLGRLQKTPINVRFLAQLGKKVPLSSLIVPILHRGRVSYLLYLDNGHKQQAPTDVGEMLILSQRIGQTVEKLVETTGKIRRAARA